MKQNGRCGTVDFSSCSNKKCDGGGTLTDYISLELLFNDCYSGPIRYLRVMISNNNP